MVKPIKVIDGKWVLKIEDDFLGGENRMVLEWPDHGVKLACSRTERPKPKLITHTAEGAPQAKPESDKQEKVQQSGMESKLDKLLSMNETYFNKIENIEKNVEISNVRVAKIENNVANQNKNFEAIQKRFMQIETKLEILMPGLGQTEISGSDVDMSNGEYDWHADHHTHKNNNPSPPIDTNVEKSINVINDNLLVQRGNVHPNPEPNNERNYTDLKIISVNTRSMTTSIELLRLLVINYEPDVLLIQETFLTKNKKTPVIEDYNPYRKDRTLPTQVGKPIRGGGLLTYVHDKYKFKEIAITQSDCDLKYQLLKYNVMNL